MKRSIDYEFLRFINVVPEEQKRIQSYYLPFFDGCRRVVDLGCGDGDFVDLLNENGIEAIGVDYDDECCAAARKRNLHVVCADVFDYLQELDEGTIDGIFSSHLVEHLPYDKVLELLHLSHRALAKGGVIVLSTPNVKAIFSHLEMFYLHFGHVSFYHPDLLRFFLEYAGFSQTAMGENPETASPYWGDAPKNFLDQGGEQRPIPLINYQLELPPGKRDVFHRLSRRAKMFLIKRVVRPYLDQINSSLSYANRNLVWIHEALRDLDRAFECWVKAVRE
jgi:SAM-dependent methyltransferase